MLFVIDMQNDFVDQKRGKMFVKDADTLVPGIIQKIKEYEKNNDLIFYTLDIHENMDDDNRTLEEKKWGQEIYTPLYKYLASHHVLTKNFYGICPKEATKIKNLYQNKERYIRKIEFIGVETHICVLANAIILQNTFHNSKIIINESLCTSSNLDWHKRALKLMKELKMEVKS